MALFLRDATSHRYASGDARRPMVVAGPPDEAGNCCVVAVAAKQISGKKLQVGVLGDGGGGQKAGVCTKQPGTGGAVGSSPPAGRTWRDGQRDSCRAGHQTSVPLAERQVSLSHRVQMPMSSSCTCADDCLSLTAALPGLQRFLSTLPPCPGTTVVYVLVSAFPIRVSAVCTSTASWHCSRRLRTTPSPSPSSRRCRRSTSPPRARPSTTRPTTCGRTRWEGLEENEKLRWSHNATCLARRPSTQATQPSMGDTHRTKVLVSSREAVEVVVAWLYGKLQPTHPLLTHTTLSSCTRPCAGAGVPEQAAGRGGGVHHCGGGAAGRGRGPVRRGIAGLDWAGLAGRRLVRCKRSRLGGDRVLRREASCCVHIGCGCMVM